MHVTEKKGFAQSFEDLCFDSSNWCGRQILEVKAPLSESKGSRKVLEVSIRITKLLIGILFIVPTFTLGCTVKLIRNPLTPFKALPRYIGSKESLSPGHVRKSTSLTPVEAKKYIPFVAMIEACFKSDQEKLKGVDGLQMIPPNIEGKDLPENFEIIGDAIVNKTTGIKLILVQNSEKTYAVFGPNYSMNPELGSEDEQKKIVGIQGSSAHKNLLGLVPQTYDDAVEVFKVLQENYPNIELVGNCSGGAIATYVGLKQQVKTTTVNSFVLGAGLQHKIGDDTLKKAHQWVTHFHVEGDFVSDHFISRKVDRLISFFPIRTPALFGQRLSIPSAYKTQKGTHEFPMGSLMHHLGYDIRTRPHQISEEERGVA